MSLVARHLEETGTPTIVIGSSLDIVTTVGAPRMVFVDIPLGNPIGPPYDREAQRSTLELALSTLAAATPAEDAGTIVARSPITWPTQEWRARYMHVGDDNRAELKRLGDERRAAQQGAKRIGEPSPNLRQAYGTR